MLLSINKLLFRVLFEKQIGCNKMFSEKRNCIFLNKEPSTNVYVY